MLSSLSHFLGSLHITQQQQQQHHQQQPQQQRQPSMVIHGSHTNEAEPEAGNSEPVSSSTFQPG